MGGDKWEVISGKREKRVNIGRGRRERGGSVGGDGDGCS